MPDKTVDSVCPLRRGLPAQLRNQGQSYSLGEWPGRSNHGRLCVKGRFVSDYPHHPHRLTKPLIRRPGSRKARISPSIPATLGRCSAKPAGRRLWIWPPAGSARSAILHGSRALAGFGSAKGSNEEAYCSRSWSERVRQQQRGPLHAALSRFQRGGIAGGTVPAVSNPVADVDQAEVILVIGANPTVNHPVAATWMKNAVKRGAKLILADPRRTELARHATYTLQFKPDTDVALLNAMLHVIIKEGLVDEDFVANRTSGFEALRRNVESFKPEAMAPICGIPADTIATVARLYATSKGSMIFWGMGVSQHVHGTDNARCLIALALITGQLGRPGTGLHPLRGQNNVQGASDAGLIPMVFPDYQRVDGAAARAKFERLWDYVADLEPGLTVVEIMNAVLTGQIRGMYIMGENPAMSDPDLDHARQALAELDWLVVQDIFLTETAYLADVVLPASAFPEKSGSFTNTDRTVQLGQRALDAPGDARQDLWIIQEMAKRLGLNWNYPGSDSGVARVFDEMRQAMPSIAGITWKRLETDGAVTYPCLKEGDPGERVVFTQDFPTTNRRGRLVPADIIPAAEQPDQNYPLVLITGRQLEHWHTGSMTRRTAVLDAIEPLPTALLHPDQLAQLGVQPGAAITIASRRGQVTLTARADPGTPLGAVFIAFCYYEAAANLLTNPALDPVGKIPEFKYCAVRVLPADNA
ncbi:MAG: molybdopterin-dependent oxidoreductase [Candidatus Competibacteraceae bacterium]